MGPQQGLPAQCRWGQQDKTELVSEQRKVVSSDLAHQLVDGAASPGGAAPDAGGGLSGPLLAPLQCCATVLNHGVSGGPSARALSGGLRACPVALVFSDSATAWAVARQAPLSVGFSRQEHWGRLPLLLQWSFPAQEPNLRLLHWQEDSLPLSHLGSPELRCGHRHSPPGTLG